MKIGLIGRYGEGEIVAGPERVARELYHELREINKYTDFIEYYFSDYRDYSVIRKIMGKRAVNSTIWRLGIIRIIFKLIRERYDVIHIVNSQRFLLAVLLLKSILRLKIVSTVHGISEIEFSDKKKSLTNRSFLDQWTEKLIIKNSDLTIVPSNLLLDEMIRYFPPDFKKVCVIPNGISSEFVSETHNYFIEDHINIIFYNSFNSLMNKGLKELINQLSEVKELKIRLFVLGYKEQIATNNKNLQIINAGLLNHKELIDFCRNINFIIKSDKFDTFSVIVAECMALGVIPIITNRVGIKDYVTDGFNGFVYGPDTSKTLTELFWEIGSNKYDLQLISENARKIASELDWKVISAEYIEAYLSVL